MRRRSFSFRSYSRESHGSARGIAQLSEQFDGWSLDMRRRMDSAFSMADEWTFPKGELMRGKFRKNYEKPEPFQPGNTDRLMLPILGQTYARALAYRLTGPGCTVTIAASSSL